MLSTSALLMNITKHLRHSELSNICNEQEHEVFAFKGMLSIVKKKNIFDRI